MSTSAIGPVFDWLLSAGVQAALTAVTPTVEIQDGWDATAGNDIFVIGRADPGESAIATDATELHIEIGGQHIEEEFDVPCYFDCWRGGGSQKEARDAALALFNAFVNYLQTDLTLAGALQAGRWAEVRSVQSIPTPTQEEAGEGRRQIILFNLHCRNKF